MRVYVEELLGLTGLLLVVGAITLHGIRYKAHYNNRTNLLITILRIYPGFLAVIYIFLYYLNDGYLFCTPMQVNNIRYDIISGVLVYTTTVTLLFYYAFLIVLRKIYGLKDNNAVFYRESIFNIILYTFLASVPIHNIGCYSFVREFILIIVLAAISGMVLVRVSMTPDDIDSSMYLNFILMVGAVTILAISFTLGIDGDRIVGSFLPPVLIIIALWFSVSLLSYLMIGPILISNIYVALGGLSDIGYHQVFIYMAFFILFIVLSLISLIKIRSNIKIFNIKLLSTEDILIVSASLFMLSSVVYQKELMGLGWFLLGIYACLKVYKLINEKISIVITGIASLASIISSLLYRSYLEIEYSTSIFSIIILVEAVILMMHGYIILVVVKRKLGYWMKASLAWVFLFFLLLGVSIGPIFHEEYRLKVDLPGKINVCNNELIIYRTDYTLSAGYTGFNINEDEIKQIINIAKSKDNIISNLSRIFNLIPDNYAFAISLSLIRRNLGSIESPGIIKSISVIDLSTRENRTYKINENMTIIIPLNKPIEVFYAFEPVESSFYFRVAMRLDEIIIPSYITIIYGNASIMHSLLKLDYREPMIIRISWNAKLFVQRAILYPPSLIGINGSIREEVYGIYMKSPVIGVIEGEIISSKTNLRIPLEINTKYALISKLISNFKENNYIDDIILLGLVYGTLQETLNLTHELNEYTIRIPTSISLIIYSSLGIFPGEILYITRKNGMSGILYYSEPLVNNFRACIIEIQTPLISGIRGSELKAIQINYIRQILYNYNYSIISKLALISSMLNKSSLIDALWLSGNGLSYTDKIMIKIFEFKFYMLGLIASFTLMPAYAFNYYYNKNKKVTKSFNGES